MPVREKGSASDTRSLGAKSGWWAKLDEFGQKHTRIILTISAGLIIFTVLIIANIAYRSSQAERVSRDIAHAATSAELRELKNRYSGAELAQVIATLGLKLAQEGKLQEAKKEYDEFLERYKDHPLSLAIETARGALEENLKFETEQKAALLQIPSLETHPLKNVKLNEKLSRIQGTLDRTQADLKHLKELASPSDSDKQRIAELEREVDLMKREFEARSSSPLGIGPVKLPHPELVIKVADKEGKTKGTVRVELFEDEAPNTVAALVELAETGHLKGLKIALIGGDERLHIQPNAEKPLDYVLPFEKTSREGHVGSLLMIRKGEHNTAGEFQLLLKSVDAPGDVTICGIMSSDMDRQTARKFTADDSIESVSVEKKRSHEYRAQTIKP